MPDTVLPTRKPRPVYRYDINGTIVTVTSRWIGEAYARNGNAGNPTNYYVWSARVEGHVIVSQAATRADAYETARRYLTGYHEVRSFVVVQREMRTAAVKL